MRTRIFPKWGVASAKIELADGSVILGEVLDISDGRVWVATEFMGEVDMPLSAISRLESDQSIDLLTIDKESLALSSLRVVNGEVVLDDDHHLSIDEVDVATLRRGRQARDITSLAVSRAPLNLIVATRTLTN